MEYVLQLWRELLALLATVMLCYAAADTLERGVQLRRQTILLEEGYVNMTFASPLMLHCLNLGNSKGGEVPLYFFPSGQDDNGMV